MERIYKTMSAAKISFDVVMVEDGSHGGRTRFTGDSPTDEEISHAR
jgi:hypothetical protein